MVQRDDVYSYESLTFQFPFLEREGSGGGESGKVGRRDPSTAN